MTRAMETLEQIQETLSEINKRTPEVSVFKFVTQVLLTLGTEHAPSAREAGHGGKERPCALRMDWAACVLPQHGEDAHFGHAEARRSVSDTGRHTGRELTVGRRMT